MIIRTTMKASHRIKAIIWTLTISAAIAHQTTLTMNKKVSISFLNVKNLKSNLIYMEFLYDISNIVYLNELWLRKTEVNHLKSIGDSTNKKVIFKSDIEPGSKGRPFGGQDWLIEKSFDIQEYKFLSRYLSYIDLKINNTSLSIIGV